MKSALLLLLLSPLVLLAPFMQTREEADTDKEALEKLREQKLAVIGCGSNISPDEIDETNMPLFEGRGQFSFPVTSASDSAQIYFNQGISMYYAFHIIEALGSFRKAARFDPSCAMAYWGQALSLGPNINDFGYSASPEALALNRKALELSGNCTAKEKKLIQAMQVRYSADTTRNRELLNQLYAAAMKAVSDSLPDADMVTLYADALMVQHPWDLYEHNGDPKPWTPLITKVLEQAMALSPDHPGANHYYIHIVEGSNNPYRGLAAANKLGTLMPGVSHIVHMPSHIYIRTGDYEKGQAVNEKALQGYTLYLRQYPAVVNGSFLYDLHNRHMEAACAALAGQFASSNKAAQGCRDGIDTAYLEAPGYGGSYSQYMWMTHDFILVRFGKWDSIIALPLLDDKWTYASVIRYFSRGMALAARNRLPEAEAELLAMQKQMEAPVMALAASNFNPPAAGAGVAEKILQGTIASKKKDLPLAAAYLLKAVELEDEMMYNEPKDWLLPARPYLGNLLLKAGKTEAAAKAFREDLVYNPRNGWAFYGLWQALKMQKKQAEAAEAKMHFEKAFYRSDVQLTGAVF